LDSFRFLIKTGLFDHEKAFNFPPRALRLGPMDKNLTIDGADLERVDLFGSRIYGVKGERLMAAMVANGRHEWAETSIVPQFVQLNGTALDIGANIGYYTAWLRMLVGSAGHVHAFEANPVTAKILHHTAALNKWDNVSIVDAAVSDACGDLMLDVGQDLRAIQDAPGYNLGGWSLLDRHEGACKIDAVTIDHYCEINAISRLSFVKMDVEGYECHVVRGAEKTLRKHHPAMMIEFGQTEKSDFRLELFEMIRSMGYSVLQIMKKPYPHLRAIGPEAMANSELFYTICIRDAAAKDMNYV
jgi:FkbM family methyltransferase